MAQDLGDLGQRGAAHGEVGGRRVPEVVEAEVVDLGGSQGLEPGLPGEERPAAAVGEDQVRVDAAELGALA